MQKGKRIKAILLDLGNVVIDWDIDRILETIGASDPEKKLLREELFGHQDWIDLDHGNKAESVVLDEVCQRTSLSNEVLEKAFLAAKTTLDTIPDTIELMRDIKAAGIRLYCLSNMSVETYEFIKDRSFFGLFDGILISGVEGVMKPQREIFQLALNRFELNAETTLFIDDSEANISAAGELRIESIRFRRSHDCYSSIRSRLFENETASAKF